MHTGEAVITEQVCCLNYLTHMLHKGDVSIAAPQWLVGFSCCCHYCPKIVTCIMMQDFKTSNDDDLLRIWLLELKLKMFSVALNDQTSKACLKM